MADKADGSLVIDTELDNEGFEKGSDKLLSSVENLAKEVNTLGKDMKNAFSGITSILQTLSAAINSAAASTGASAQEATQATEASEQATRTRVHAAEQAAQAQANAVEQTAQAQARAAQQAAKAQSRTASATDAAAAATKKFDKELARLQKQINTAKNDLSGYYQGLAEIRQSTDEWMMQANGANAAEQITNILQIEAMQIEAINEKYAAKLDALKQLEAQYARVAAARDAAYQAAAEQAQAAAAQAATSGAQTLSQQLAAVREQIAATKSELEGYGQKVAAIKQATDEALRGVADGPDAERQVNALLAEEERQLAELKQSYIEKMQILAGLEEEHRRIASAVVAEKLAQEQASGLSGAIRALSQAFRENVTEEKNLDAAAARVVSVLGDVGSTALTAAKNLLKLPFKLIATGAKKAVSGLKRFCTQSKKTALSANEIAKALTRIRRMLISRFKERFITMLFKNVGEALKQLALFDSQFNDTMSGIMNRANQLGGNIAVTAANLISVLEPAITTIINLLNQAVTSMNQFFAALSGRRSYTAAKLGAEQYAEATDAAAEAQKKLNAELYSFDELNRQSDPTTGADTDETGIQFEELPVDLPAEVQRWVDDLKSAWSRADWGGLGETVAEGLNAAVRAADDWINHVLHPRGREWAVRAGEILNGLFDKVDWPSLGKTVADGCNAIADIVNNFFTTFKAKNFGRGIGTTIKSWFDNIDWPLIGQTFANGWNTIIRTIEGIVTTPGIWASIGHSIGEFVKSWFTTIDLNSIATSIIATFNGVTAFINSFLDQNPFEGVAEKVYSAINRVLHEVKWSELGAAIGRLFMTVLRNLVTVVQQVDWVQLGVAVGQALSSINWFEVIGYIAQFVGAALKAMFEFLGGMIKGDGLGVLIAGFTFLAGNLAVKLAGAIFMAPLQQALTSVIADLLKGVIGSAGIGSWGAKILAAGKGVVTGLIGKIGGIAVKVLPAIGATLTKIVSGIVAAIGGWPVVIIAAAAAVITALVIWIKNGGGEVIQGFIDGVKEKWEAVKQALRDFADLWITGFKSLFGIHSPSTVMAEQGGYVMDGLLQGISQNWPAIMEFLSNGASELLQTLSGKWQEMSANAKENWSVLKTNVTTAFENAKTALRDTATQIGTALSSKWSEICTNAQTAWSNVKTTLSNAMSGSRSSAQSSASGMRSDLNSTFGGIVSNAQTTWSNLQTATLNRFSNLRTNVLNAWVNLRSNLNEVKWDNVGNNLVAGLNNGIVGAWGGLMGNVSGLVNSLIQRVNRLFDINSPSGVFQRIGEFLDLGLARGMQDGERGLLTTAKNIATAVTEGMTPDTPNVQMNVDSVVGSMQAIISSLGSLAVTFQTIANALTAIGGFTLPNIAAGTVVPYQTRVAANAAPAGAEGGVETYLLGILAELQALSRSVRNGDGKQTGDVRVIIGGREVFQVVVDENNRAVRMTGKSPLKV